MEPTFLVETKDIRSPRTMRGPDLPKALIYHCMVSINQTFTFLHGGKMDAKPFKKTVRSYDRNKGADGKYFAYHSFTYWNAIGTSTFNFESSYLFDWTSMKWIQVFYLLKFCDLDPFKTILFLIFSYCLTILVDKNLMNYQHSAV